MNEQYNVGMGMAKTAALQGLDYPGRMSFKENINMRIADSEKRLAELKELAGLLEENPKLERVLELMGKGIY